MRIQVSLSHDDFSAAQESSLPRDSLTTVGDGILMLQKLMVDKKMVASGFMPDGNFSLLLRPVSLVP